MSNLLKSSIATVLFVTISQSCQMSNQTKNIAIFEGNNWYSGEKQVFKNDSSICHTYYDTITNQLQQLQTFPIELNDTSLIYTRFQKMGYYDENKEFIITHLEKLIDTITYDLMHINKKPKLSKIYIRRACIGFSGKCKLNIVRN